MSIRTYTIIAHIQIQSIGSFVVIEAIRPLVASADSFTNNPFYIRPDTLKLNPTLNRQIAQNTQRSTISRPQILRAGRLKVNAVAV